MCEAVGDAGGRQMARLESSLNSKEWRGRGGLYRWAGSQEGGRPLNFKWPLGQTIGWGNKTITSGRDLSHYQ